MTPLQLGGQNVINAINEGTVATVIDLWDQNLLAHKVNRHTDVKEILTQNFQFSQENAEYWLKWFKVS